MGKALEKFLSNEIAKIGAMDLGTFMGHVLTHPEYGYYMNRDPFGVSGDFTTAPEISQVFGEILGAWVAHIWELMGHPAEFTLLECGPGRGTLMVDMLRATWNVPSFASACKPCFLESSPHLRSQQEILTEGLGFDFSWIDRLEEIASHRPVIVIGNEFLDALPVRQLQKNAQSWQERCVQMVGQGFDMTLQPAPAELITAVPASLRGLPHGKIVEISPARAGFMRDVMALLERAGGVSLFIDYGYTQSAAGDTLQAVHHHGFVDVLSHIGDADLSAHVDFAALRDVAEKAGADRVALADQGTFLNVLGAEVRAHYLHEKAVDDIQRQEVMAGYQRLVAPDQMGVLFKVMGASKGFEFDLPGF